MFFASFPPFASFFRRILQQGPVGASAVIREMDALPLWGKINIFFSPLLTFTGSLGIIIFKSIEILIQSISRSLI